MNKNDENECYNCATPIDKLTRYLVGAYYYCGQCKAGMSVERAQADSEDSHYRNYRTCERSDD